MPEEAAVNAQDDTSGVRTGARRVIPRREFRHLRAWGGARVAGGGVLTVCGLLTLFLGGRDAKTYAWATAFLLLAAANLAAGVWELRVAGTVSSGH